METASDRMLAGFGGAMGVLMVPPGLATGRWWVLLPAALMITGSVMLWRESGKHVMPVGRVSEDVAFQRATRRRGVASLIFFAGVAVTMICARVFEGS